MGVDFDVGRMPMSRTSVLKGYFEVFMKGSTLHFAFFIFLKIILI